MYIGFLSSNNLSAQSSAIRARPMVIPRSWVTPLQWLPDHLVGVPVTATIVSVCAGAGYCCKSCAGHFSELALDAELSGTIIMALMFWLDAYFVTVSNVYSWRPQKNKEHCLLAIVLAALESPLWDLGSSFFSD